MEPSGRTRCHGHKLEHKGFPFNTREHFFGKEKENLSEWLCTTTRSLERLWSLLCRSSEATWTWPWAPGLWVSDWITWTQRSLLISVVLWGNWKFGNSLQYRSGEKRYILREYGRDCVHAVNSTWQDRGLSSRIKPRFGFILSFLTAFSIYCFLRQVAEL